MKKIKLLTALTSLSTICLTTPIVATSCSYGITMSDINFDGASNCSLENLTTSIKIKMSDPTNLDATVNLTFHGKSGKNIIFTPYFDESKSTKVIIQNDNQLFIPKGTLSHIGSIKAEEKDEKGDIISTQEVDVNIAAVDPKARIEIKIPERSDANCWIDASRDINTINAINLNNNAYIQLSLTDTSISLSTLDVSFGGTIDSSGLWEISASAVAKNVEISCSDPLVPSLKVNLDTPINISGEVTHSSGEPSTEQISPSGKTALKNTLIEGDCVELILNNNPENIALNHWSVHINGKQATGEISNLNKWWISEEDETNAKNGKMITVTAYNASEESGDSVIATLMFTTKKEISN